MRSKKGFTLIELLAVIVILAIIALIATPIILNMINDARKSAAVDSAYGYIEAIEYQNSISQLDSTKNPPITETDVSKINGLVNLKGTKPTSGTVTIENGRVTEATLVINGYTVKYDGSKATVEGEKTEEKEEEKTEEEVTGPTSENPDTTKTKGLIKIVYLDPTDLTKTCDATNSVSTTGTKTGCMKWYAYKDDGTNYTMILDHNTTPLVAWISSDDYTKANTDGTKCPTIACNDKGSITVTNKLKKDTTGWNGNPRLIIADEVAEITGAKDDLDWTSDKPYSNTPVKGTSVPWFYLDGYGTTYTKWQEKVANSSTKSKYAWLYDNTYECTNYGCNIADDIKYEDEITGNFNNIYGYWSSSPVVGISNFAWLVSRGGDLSIDYIDSSGGTGISNFVDSMNGVRPVITVEKSLIK